MPTGLIAALPVYKEELYQMILNLRTFALTINSEDPSKDEQVMRQLAEGIANATNNFVIQSLVIIAPSAISVAGANAGGPVISVNILPVQGEIE